MQKADGTYTFRASGLDALDTTGADVGPGHTLMVEQPGLLVPATGQVSMVDMRDAMLVDHPYQLPLVEMLTATGISKERCERINLGYMDPATVDPAAWQGRDGWLVVPRAGEMLYRVGQPPTWADRK